MDVTQGELEMECLALFPETTPQVKTAPHKERDSPSQRSRATPALTVLVARERIPLGQMSPPRVDDWTAKYHNIWTRLTSHQFYDMLQQIPPNQGLLMRWLPDISSLSIAALGAATRTSHKLYLQTGKCFSLHRIAEENARFLAEHAILHGFVVCSEHSNASDPCRILIELIEELTSDDLPLLVSLTALWIFMMSSWQATNTSNRVTRLPGTFGIISRYVSRNDSLSKLLESQALLDSLLELSCDDEFERAEEAFEEIAGCYCALLDYTVELTKTSDVVLRKCDRTDRVSG